MTGLMLIDKAPDWTSHDVVAKCRGILRERRIGHAGTLDPMATGLLVLFIGRATRAVSYLPGTKRYRARLRFGEETDTGDSTGRLLRRTEHIPTLDELAAVLPRFTGALRQTPPMVSAVQVGGQRLYKLARQGLEVERAARPIEVYRLDCLGEENGEPLLDIECSAGTYVRVLIADIGRALGSAAVMTALRRTHSGPYNVGDACPVEQAGAERLLPLDSLFAAQPALTLDDAQERRLRHGVAALAGPAQMSGPVRLYGRGQAFLALGRVENGEIRVEKTFFEV